MPVGQGGFHIGGLSIVRPHSSCTNHGRGVDRFAEADFLYVYDCGSEPKKFVEREIRVFAKHRAHSRLDMLFLSHFDRDHIDGTPKLLSGKYGFQVDTILLPFVDEAERVIAFARAAASEGGGDGAISHFFKNMIIDPVVTLQEFGPRQIIQVADSEGNGPIDGNSSDAPLSNDHDAHLSWKLVAENSETKKSLKIYRIPSNDKSEVFVVRNAAVSVLDRSGGFEWRLKPWVKPANPLNVALFYDTAEQELGWDAGSFVSRMKNRIDRYNVVTSERTKLARAYTKAFTDKNLTSMCLYSGPAKPDTLEALTIEPFLPCSCKTKIGWMGTGDAHLKEDADIDQFEQFYQREIDYVSSFCFPHHGSIENSNPDRLVSNADNWIASADPIHNWLHPHPSLFVSALEKGETRHVRSSEYSAFDEAVVVFAKI
jgi:hypothetical protein